jgi:hypothetical protein
MTLIAHVPRRGAQRRIVWNDDEGKAVKIREGLRNDLINDA